MAVMNPLNLEIEIAEPKTGMAKAVLNELIEQLQIFADTGKQHIIDLTSLPMTSSDKHELESLLGTGEINITLSTIGESQINETAFSGIWWIKHYTPDRKLISELIEITDVPAIIKSHQDDIKHAANEIKNIINNDEQEIRYE